MAATRLGLQILSKEALDEIEGTAFRLLADVGISLQHAGAMELLHGLGCQIRDVRVFDRHYVIDWALDRVTPHRQFFRRDGAEVFELGNGQVRFKSGGGLPFAFDLDNGERRLPLLRDVAEATRLLDALPNVDVIIPLFGPQDV